MTIKLTEELKQALIAIDPYYSQKQQLKIFGICINTMMKLRRQAGLETKPKGRPKTQIATFKNEEQQYTKDVEQLLKDIPNVMEEARKKPIRKRRK